MSNITFHWKLSQTPEQAERSTAKCVANYLFLRIRMCEGITQTEKTYTNLRFINAKTIIRGTES
jgi:hypothetical protein